MNRLRIQSLMGSVIAAASLAGFAQEARLFNAREQARPVSSSLEVEFRKLVKGETGPAWIGYAMPMVEGNHRICCYSSEESHKPAAVRLGRCRLEGHDHGMNFNTDNDDDKSDGPRRLLVMFRVAESNVEKIRVFTDDCEIDAGGLTVHWLTGVKAHESINLLASYVNGSGETTKSGRKLSESAVAAIALHADAAADASLDSFVDAKRPEEIRKNTAFWLGSVRGQKGYEIVKRMMREDPSDKVREQCTFALHISKVPQAIGTLIDAARNDRSSHVRGQALFWLSQKAGDKAVNAITDAIENDPETEVKKKAVFALSQLPEGTGVPKLIQVARVNRNKEVRKDAMFWLGQSKDDRALAFFEEVLTR